MRVFLSAMFCGALLCMAALSGVALLAGGTADPCVAAVNAHMERRPPPAGLEEVSRRLMVGMLREAGPLACYRAALNAALS